MTERRHSHPACLDDEALLKQCRVHTGRAGGPGGQHRNKVETHVELLHTPTGVTAQAGERRSQVENKGVALRRLRLALAVNVRCAVAPPPRVAGRTREAVLEALDAADHLAARSDLWRSRVRGGKIACNPDHHDFPALLAEALDLIAECDWDPKPAAERLGISPTQLVRFVKDCPEALVKWNQERGERSLHLLR